MKIIHAGLPRAGNVWLHAILTEILSLRKKNRNLKCYISQQPIYEIARNWDLGFKRQASIDWIDINRMDVRARISSIYKEPLTHWKKYLNKTSIVASHSYFSGMTRNVFKDFDIIYYLIRDPRDILISRSRYDLTLYMKKFYPQPYCNSRDYIENRLEELIGRWVFHVANYLYHEKNLKIKCLFYESLLSNYQCEVSKIADVLKIEITRGELNKIARMTSLNSMKKTGYKGHLWQGRAGTWHDVLSIKQKIKANNIGGSLLKILYPANKLNHNYSEVIKFLEQKMGRTF